MELGLINLCSGFVGFVFFFGLFAYPLFLLRELLAGRGISPLYSRSKSVILRGPLATVYLLLIWAFSWYGSLCFLNLGVKLWFGIQLPSWVPMLPEKTNGRYH